MAGLAVRVALICAVAAAVATPVAADTPLIPESDPLPWTDPAHMSALEQVANQVASHIAQRPVRVYCDGGHDWSTLAADQKFDPNLYDTWVVSWYWTDSRTFSQNSDIAHVSPRICQRLWEFGNAAAKPTKCPTVVRQSETISVTIKVPNMVSRRVRIRGKWHVVSRIVLVPTRVTKHITRRVDGPPGPCYSSAGLAPGTSADYGNYVWALWQLARDSVYMFDWRVGASIDGAWEVRANCLGMQWLGWVAAQLGDTPDDGHALASYAYNVIYPRGEGQPYWSADCRENGPLDQSPGDGVWP
jgi:hypothetical protein